MNRIFGALLVAAVLCATATAKTALAADLRAPAGRIILTVSGQIGVSNMPDGTAAFDLAMLDEFPQISFKTSTIWTEGVSDYSGVELSALLEAVEADGTNLRLTALNDYAIGVPEAEAITGGPLLATRKAGTPLSVRDKGPIWLIYPFDDKPEYRTEVTYSHSIWQVKSIEVEK